MTRLQFLTVPLGVLTAKTRPEILTLVSERNSSYRNGKLTWQGEWLNWMSTEWADLNADYPYLHGPLKADTKAIRDRLPRSVYEYTDTKGKIVDITEFRYRRVQDV